MFSLRCFLPSMLLLVLTGGGWGADRPPEGAELEHYREELGINGFTAPSIARIFDQLRLLEPLPFDKVWRTPETELPEDRARLALVAGRTLADGFLAVSAQKTSRLEPVGRTLLRAGRGLGIGDRVTRHTGAMLELGARGDWGALREELVRAQADVEGAMLALKDEEIAHLVALGGWLRGMEIAAVCAYEEYTPERALVLVQEDLLAYFLDRLGTLPPRRRGKPPFPEITASLQAMERLLKGAAGKPPERELVKQVRDEARAAVRAMGVPKAE